MKIITSIDTQRPDKPLNSIPIGMVFIGVIGLYSGIFLKLDAPYNVVYFGTLDTPSRATFVSFLSSAIVKEYLPYPAATLSLGNPGWAAKDICTESSTISSPTGGQSCPYSG